MLNATFQSHPIKMGCCNTITKCLIVTTINPIWHSHPVHPGTKKFTICSLKSKETYHFKHPIAISNQDQGLQDWMKHHGFTDILHVLSNF